MFYSSTQGGAALALGFGLTRLRRISDHPTSVPHIPLFELHRVFPEQPSQFVLKRLPPMMLRLTLDVSREGLDVRRTDGKSAVSILPMEIAERWITIVQHARRRFLHIPHQIGDRRLPAETAKDVNMILDAANDEAGAIHVVERGREVSMHILLQFLAFQPREPILGREDDVQIDLGKRLRHWRTSRTIDRRTAAIESIATPIGNPFRVARLFGAIATQGALRDPGLRLVTPSA